MDKKNIDFPLTRLEKIKQAMIIQYLDNVNLDAIMEFYDSMVEHLFHGDFDSVFLSKSLVGLDEEEKQELFQLARKYKNLCFCMGEESYWADSIEGVYLSDLDLVCMKLFDNYDFLLGLAKDGGEAALKQLSAFSGGSMDATGSIIDYLRNVFGEDDVLKDIIIEMSKGNGSFAGLSDKQKEILCTYPNGILLEWKNQEAHRIPAKKLIEKIQEKYFGSKTKDYASFETLGKVLADAEEFESVILDIYYGDQDSYPTSKRKL